LAELSVDSVALCYRFRKAAACSRTASVGERLKADLHQPIITRDEHLTRSPREIDFVPVEKMQSSQPMDETECRDDGDQCAVADG
jgi:hypothetical protein